MKTYMKTIAIGTALLTAAGAGCGGDEDTGPLGNVDSLIVLQRPKRNDMGDIFQYTSYKPKTESGVNARLIKLEPPTADGKQTVICCDQAGAEFANVDISGYDIDFDAKRIVFSGKLSGSTNYGLFILTLADGSVDQVPTDPARDYVSPIFLPGDKIMFTTNSIVEAGARQHRDEYERGTTLQLGRISTDGTGEELGARNLSHRTFPTLMSDGRVMFTQWDHLGGMNAGHLMFVNQDLTNLREGYGKEGTGASNSVLKATEISAGRFVAIATARNRTIQAGALIDVKLGIKKTDGDTVTAAERQSEANATYTDLTPDVPHGNEPSADTVGRYYDAFPLNAKDKPDLVVSWANGPVESSVLGAAGLEADFGVYLLDTKNNQRHPLLDNPEMWDIFPRPLQERAVPGISGSSIDPALNGQTMIGSMDVYQSSLKTFTPNSIYGVRVMEGFSSEEGFPEMFGTTMFEGQANLGVARVQADGSWLATVPSNVPLHVQAVDVFGMSIFSEPVWVSGRKNEARVCGGCHEARDKATIIEPGQTDAFAVGPTQMYGLTPRAQRKSMDFSRDKVMGVAWDTTVQKVFDNNACVTCHGDSNTAGMQPYTITDPATGMSVKWTLNLENKPLPAAFAELGGEPAFTASYFSIAGPDMEAIEKGGLVVSTCSAPNCTKLNYASPEDSRGSAIIKALNPKRQFPTQTSERAFTTSPHQNNNISADEFYQLILNIDMGLNFYSRENSPGLNNY